MSGRDEMTVDFVGRCSLPFIEVRLCDNDDRYLALVDSGSECTLFDEALVEGNCHVNFKDEDECILMCMAGERKGRMKWLETTIVVTDPDGNEHPFRCEGITSDLSKIAEMANYRSGSDLRFGMLLGAGTLQDESVTIDFDNRKVSFRNKDSKD